MSDPIDFNGTSDLPTAEELIAELNEAREGLASAEREIEILRGIIEHAAELVYDLRSELQVGDLR